MINSVGKFLIAYTVLCATSLPADPTFPGEPPTPPLRKILENKNVQKKVDEFNSGCQTRLSKKACACVTENVKLKLNGRDFDETDLDLLISIVSRKKLKKFSQLNKYSLTYDMIEEIESECVIDSNWRMDIQEE